MNNKKNFYLLFLFALFFITSCATTPPTPVQKQDAKVFAHVSHIAKSRQWPYSTDFFYNLKITESSEFFETTLIANTIKYLSPYYQIYPESSFVRFDTMHFKSDAIKHLKYVKNLAFSKTPDAIAVEFDLDNIKDNIHVKLSLDPEAFVYMSEPCDGNILHLIGKNNVTYRSLPEVCNNDPSCINRYASTAGGAGIWTFYGETNWKGVFGQLHNCALQKQPYENINYKIFERNVLMARYHHIPDEDYNNENYVYYVGKNLGTYNNIHALNFILNMLTLGYAGKVEITAPENVKKEIEANAEKIKDARILIMNKDDMFNGILYNDILTPENKLLFSLFAYAIHSSNNDREEK